MKEEKKTLDQPIQTNSLKIIEEECLVYCNNETINFPKRVFELLQFLFRNPNKVFSRDVLLEKVWGDDASVMARTVDTYIRKIREKIGEEYIQTIKGVGYKFTHPS